MSWLTGEKKVGTISTRLPADKTWTSDNTTDSINRRWHEAIAIANVKADDFTINPPQRRYSDVEKIGMRLDIPPGPMMGFDSIHVAPMGDSKKVVFLIVNGKPLMIEDDEHLFPSDTLITQLRLLRR
jgi:hypothetical protein